MATEASLKKIDLKKKVTVVATDKHAYAAKGTELTMHPELANYLGKKQWVVKAKAKDE